MMRKKKRYEQDDVNRILGVQCQYCGSDNLIVNRTVRAQNRVVRYRKCRECQLTTVTEEANREGT